MKANPQTRSSSENPYVQISINKNGNAGTFSDDYQFTQFKKNHFDKTYEFDGESFRLQFKNYIPDAAEAVVEDPNGIPMLTFVTVENGERRSELIKAGETITTAGLKLSLNAETADPATIRINYTPEAGLTFKAPVDATVTNMTGGTTETLVKDSSHVLNTMQLYDFEGMQLVVQAVFCHRENHDCKLSS